MIVVVCGCGMRHELPDEWAGKSGRCPKCKRVMHVPAAEPDAKKQGAPEAREEITHEAPTGIAHDDALPIQKADNAGGDAGTPHRPRSASDAPPADQMKVQGTSVHFDAMDPDKAAEVKFEYQEVSDEDVGKTPQELAEKPDKIRFRCKCGKVLVAPADRAGAKVRCPKCRKVLKVPDLETTEKKADEVRGHFGYEARGAQTEHICDACGAFMKPGSLICIDCGTHKMSGEKLATAIGDDAFRGEGGLLSSLKFWKRKQHGAKTIAEDRGTTDNGEDAPSPSEKKPGK